MTAPFSLRIHTENGAFGPIYLYLLESIQRRMLWLCQRNRPYSLSQTDCVSLFGRGPERGVLFLAAEFTAAEMRAK